MAKMFFSDVNHANDVTPSLSVGTLDASSSIGYISNGNPALPILLTTTTIRLAWDFVTPRSMDVAAIINSNVNGAGTLRIQANTTNTWAGPPVDEAFTIGAVDSDGYMPNAFIDLSAHSAYRWWSLTSSVANPVAIQIGELWMGDYVSLTHNPSWGFQDEDIRPGRTIKQTAAGVSWVYAALARQRRLLGIVETNDAGATQMRDWHGQAKGRDRPSLIVFDPGVNEARMVRWDADFVDQPLFTDSHRMSVGWTELSPGPPPPLI